MEFWMYCVVFSNGMKKIIIETFKIREKKIKLEFCNENMGGFSIKYLYKIVVFVC